VAPPTDIDVTTGADPGEPSEGTGAEPAPTGSATAVTTDVTTGAPQEPADQASSRARTRRASRLGLIAVLLVPLLDNLPAILGIVKYQPEATTSGLGFITKVGFTHGQAFIDPNVGYNSQAVGHAAALAWLHLHIPWWNLNEGLGMPLAASIQSAAFFPFVLLQALPQGSLWFHIALECAIGWATYALLRELRCSPFAAAIGAIAFELNGAIAWVTNAPANPVAFLPVCLLGVEYVINAAGAKRRGGWVLLALGVWLSIVSGFPEVAAINGGLVAVWFLVRIAQRPRDAGRAVWRGALGVGVGIILAAPVLNAFVRYLRVGNVGKHTVALASIVTIPRAGLAQLVSPYVFGGIFDSQDPTIFVVWSRIGGYTGVTMLVLAVASLFGARERLLRIVLAAWALLFMGSAFNMPVAHQIVSHLPGMSHIAVYRYATASALLCLCILSALFLDDAVGLPSLHLSARLVPGILLAVGLFAAGFLAAPGGRAWAHHFLPKWYWGSIALIGGVVLMMCIVALLALTRWRRFVPVLLGLTLAIEAFGYFAVPILAFPRAVHYDNTVVTFLRNNLGTQRFYTVEPISPNYGSYFAISSLDAADLPIPKNWATYVHTKLNPYVFSWQFGNGGPQGATGVAPLAAMIANFPNYEASGVKFLLTPSTTHLNKYFQPRLGGGVATVDGGASIVLGWRPPSYLPLGRLTGMAIPMPSGLPAGLVVTACSGPSCVVAAHAGQSAFGQEFTFPTPITLGPSFTVHLAASNAAPVQILTVPNMPSTPASVVADGVLLSTAGMSRGAVATFHYDPASIPVLVAHTEAANVYRLPNPAPIASAPGCVTVAHSQTSFTVHCAAASKLTYRELSFPGWKATVAGQPAAISTVNSVFQQVAVPAGTSAVSFSYEPPETVWMWILALLGVVVIAVGLVRRRKPSNSARLAAATTVGGAPASSALATAVAPPLTPPSTADGDASTSTTGVEKSSATGAAPDVAPGAAPGVATADANDAAGEQAASEVRDAPEHESGPAV